MSDEIQLFVNGPDHKSEWRGADLYLEIDGEWVKTDNVLTVSVEPEVKPMENTIQIPNPYPNHAWSLEINKKTHRVRFPRENEDENFVRIVVEPIGPKE